MEDEVDLDNEFEDILSGDEEGEKEAELEAETEDEDEELSQWQARDRHVRQKVANMYRFTNSVDIRRMPKSTFDVAMGTSVLLELPESVSNAVPVGNMVVELLPVEGIPALAEIKTEMASDACSTPTEANKEGSVDDVTVELIEDTTAPLEKIPPGTASDDCSTLPQASNKTAAVCKPTLNAEQMRSTQKTKLMFQTNSVISIHNGDRLLRVALTETLPFMCTLCGETYAHTRLLQDHAEQSHGYFQSLVDEREPRKKPVIITKNFGKRDSTITTLETNHANAQGAQGSAQEGPKPSNMDILEEKLPEVPLSPNVDESRTEKTTDELHVSAQRDGMTTQAKQSGRKRRREDNADTIESKHESHSSNNTLENSEIGVKRVKKKKSKMSRKMKKDESGKDKYTVINGDHIVQKRVEETKCQPKRPLTIHCVVCHLCCLAKSYKAHLAEAHCIYPSREAAEIAARKRTKIEKNRELNDSNVKENGGDLNCSNGQENDSIGRAENQTDRCAENRTNPSAEKDILKCLFCESYVMDERTLEKHMRAHCGMPGIKCDICVEGIRLWENNQLDQMQDLSERYLSKDRRSQDIDFKSSDSTPKYPNSRVISTCYECNEQFYFRFHMTNHYSKAHSSLTCKECGESIPNMMALCRHSVKRHPPGIFRCQWCPRRVHDLGRLNFHIQGHLGMHKCSGCEKLFIEKRALEYHLKKYENCPEHFTKGTEDSSLEPEDNQKRGFRMIVCEVCNATFVNKGRFERHMSLAHPERSDTASKDDKFVCDTCGNVFSTKNYLKMHMRVHNKRYPCPYSDCTKKFTAPGILRAHMETHVVVPTWVCDDCGKTFQHSGSLRFHKRTHTDKKTKCEICNNTFKGLPSLSAHMREAHDLEPSFSCGVCDESFASRQLLLAHAKVHSERAIDFPCDKCPCAFATEALLDQHVQSFHNKKSYYCAACDKNFRRLDVLKQHHLKEHTDHLPKDPATYQTCGPDGLQIEVQEQIEIEDSQNYDGVVVIEYPIHEGTEQAIVDIVSKLQA